MKLEASRFGHGLLTYSLLNNMPIVAAANKNLVSVDKLFGNVREEVPRLAAGIGQVQEPELIGAKARHRHHRQHGAYLHPPGQAGVRARGVYRQPEKQRPLARLKAAVNAYLEQRAGEKEPPMAFWNVDEFAGDHYYIGGQYQQDGATVSGTARLYREDQNWRLSPFSGSADTVGKLAAEIVNGRLRFWTNRSRFFPAVASMGSLMTRQKNKTSRSVSQNFANFPP